MTAPPTTTTTAAPTTTTGPVASGIQIGSGPQAAYTVQPQPAPGTCHYGSSGPYPLPDPRCTPGAVNPLVTQATISSTICVSGYTSGIRPPESVTGREKAGSAAAYGYTGSFHTGEYDHLIAVGAGRRPQRPGQPVGGAERPAWRDQHLQHEGRAGEQAAQPRVSGQLTLDAARQAIATNWAAAYQQYG